MEFKHVSVLLEETVEALQVKPDGIYVDGTLGRTCLPDLPASGGSGPFCRDRSG